MRLELRSPRFGVERSTSGLPMPVVSSVYDLVVYLG